MNKNAIAGAIIYWPIVRLVHAFNPMMERICFVLVFVHQFCWAWAWAMSMLSVIGVGDCIGDLCANVIIESIWTKNCCLSGWFVLSYKQIECVYSMRIMYTLCILCIHIREADICTASIIRCMRIASMVYGLFYTRIWLDES